MKAYKSKDNWTDDWQRYENGKQYNRKLEPLNYYDAASLHWDFYNSYQYPGLEDVDAPKPVFNIINRIVQYFVSAVTSTKTEVNIEPMAYIDDDTWRLTENAAEIVNAQIDNLFDQHRMPIKIRMAALDGAVTGDFAMHLYFDPSKKPYGGMFDGMGIEGEICLELVDGANVYLGNPNNNKCNKDVQPYVIVAGRDTVKSLKEEAERYKNKDVTLTGDKDYEEQIGFGGKIEIESDNEQTDKATYIIVYTYKDGKILVSKSTQSCYIYKDIDTGLDDYPVAWGNWDIMKNQYHGKSLVAGIIPNQIFINRAFAAVMIHLMNNAFQKPVYDAERITSWTSEIGVALPVYDLQPGESIRNVAAYLDNGSFNPQILQVIDMAKQMTMELSGATEAALGNIKPENTSAIIAVTRQSAIPLENPRANIKEWVHDIVKIMMDMMASKYGIRPIVIEREGQKVVEMFDFGQLKNLYLNANIQIGDGSYYSELASLQTLDNLLAQDRITAIQYFERINKINPDYIPDIQGLIEEMKQQMAMQQQMPMEQDIMGFVQGLPEDVQAQLAQLPEEEREAQIMAMMQQMQ